LIELNDRERALIRIGSIERLINTTIRLVARLRNSVDPAIREDADGCWQDWKDNRLLLKKLWEREREAIHQAHMKGER